MIIADNVCPTKDRKTQAWVAKLSSTYLEHYKIFRKNTNL